MGSNPISSIFHFTGKVVVRYKLQPEKKPQQLKSCARAPIKGPLRAALPRNSHFLHLKNELLDMTLSGAYTGPRNCAALGDAALGSPFRTPFASLLTRGIKKKSHELFPEKPGPHPEERRKKLPKKGKK